MGMIERPTGPIDPKTGRVIEQQQKPLKTFIAEGSGWKDVTVPQAPMLPTSRPVTDGRSR